MTRSFCTTHCFSRDHDVVTSWQSSTGRVVLRRRRATRRLAQVGPHATSRRYEVTTTSTLRGTRSGERRRDVASPRTLHKDWEDLAQAVRWEEQERKLGPPPTMGEAGTPQDGAAGGGVCGRSPCRTFHLTQGGTTPPSLRSSPITALKARVSRSHHSSALAIGAVTAK
jgi:hypothetical protein